MADPRSQRNDHTSDQNLQSPGWTGETILEDPYSRKPDTPSSFPNPNSPSHTLPPGWTGGTVLEDPHSRGIPPQPSDAPSAGPDPSRPATFSPSTSAPTYSVSSPNPPLPLGWAGETILEETPAPATILEPLPNTLTGETIPEKPLRELLPSRTPQYPPSPLE